MTRSPKHRLGSLLGLSAALGAVLALEIMAGPFFVPEAPPVIPGAKNSGVSPDNPPAERPAIETFAEIVKRPLFAESRRPPSKAEVKVAANEPPPETLDLIGVVISAQGRMALLRTLTTSEVTRAVEGQSVGGWEVSDIKPTQVVLRRGNDSEVIKINDAAAASAAPPAANASPPASDPSAMSSPAAANTPAAVNPLLVGVPNSPAQASGDASSQVKQPPPPDTSGGAPEE